MKVGITLPQFRDHPGEAVAVAVRAEAAGLDGVFAFDHMWPLGRPDGPAQHGPTLVAALAAETDRLAVGTLVARVGLLPDDLLVRTFATIAMVAGDRLIAGVGVGDRLSRDENLAFGIAYEPASRRVDALAGVARRLRTLGIRTWVGGRSEATRAVARAEADAVNLWGVDPSEVATEAARGEVTWAGRVDVGTTDLAALLVSVQGAGATWAVVAPVGADWDRAVDIVGSAAGTPG